MSRPVYLFSAVAVSAVLGLPSRPALLVVSTPGGGSGQLPPAGPVITTFDPAVTSRRVTSWYYGDGSALFNQVDCTASEIAMDYRQDVRAVLASAGITVVDE